MSENEQAEKLEQWAGRVLWLNRNDYCTSFMQVGGHDLGKGADAAPLYIHTDGGDRYQLHVLPAGELERMRALIAEVEGVTSISTRDCCGCMYALRKVLARHDAETAQDK